MVHDDAFLLPHQHVRQLDTSQTCNTSDSLHQGKAYVLRSSNYFELLHRVEAMEWSRTFGRFTTLVDALGRP